MDAVIVEDLKVEWATMQNRLREQLISEDRFAGEIKYVAGADISFVPESDTKAVASLIILDYESLDVVCELFREIELTVPYIPNFLSFREASHVMDLYDQLKLESPQYLPQVLLLDGNGVLHERRFGLACHIGVLLGIPTIGVAKNYNVVSFIPLDTKSIRTQFKETCFRRGDFLNLTSSDVGKVYGMALKVQDTVERPLYVSCGNLVSLETAREIVLHCCRRYKIPEPTRQADLRSREYIRLHS
jgi:deoxyinosine 3'endonuclease (endonuclease V)